MRETAGEIEKLQALIEDSLARAGPHLRRTFRPPDCTLSAERLIARFTGRRQVAVATVTGRGEPRVAPVDAILLHARFHFGTHATAARIRHLRRRPAVSLTYFEGDELAVVAHGTAELIEFGHPDFRDVDSEFLAVYGGTPSTAEEHVVFVRLEPTALYTFAREV